MPRPETVKTHWRDKELKLYVRPWRQSDDSVIREVLERRAYERHGVALDASRRWLDAGGHIGTFALAAASAGSSVHSFEPHPENFELLQRNAQRNRLDHLIKGHEAALVPQKDCCRKVPLHLAPRSTSFHSIQTPFRNGESVPVRTASLEAFLETHPKVDGIKMDVEGSEAALLTALLRRPDLLERINQLVFEWDFKHDPRTAPLRAVVRRLERAGFVVAAHSHVFKRELWKAWPSGVIVYARRPTEGEAHTPRSPRSRSLRRDA